MPSTKRRSSNASAVIVVSSDEEEEVRLYGLTLSRAPLAIA